MDARHEILLGQILEELRTQTGLLLELQRRLDEMEKGLNHDENVKMNVGEPERRS
jgi:hypothetical protein